MMTRTHVALMAFLLACKIFNCQEHLVVLTYDFVSEVSVGFTAEYNFTFSNISLDGKYMLFFDGRRLAKSNDNSVYYCAILKRNGSKLGSLIAMQAILKDVSFSQTLSGNDEFEGKLLLLEENSAYRSCNCEVGEVQRTENYQPGSKNCYLLVEFEILDDFVTKNLPASKAQDNTQPDQKKLPKLLINPKIVSNLSDPDSVVSTDKKMVMVIEIDRDFEDGKENSSSDLNFGELLNAFTISRHGLGNDHRISLKDKQDAAKSVTVMKISGYESTSPVLTKYTTVTKSVLNDLKAESEKEKKDSDTDGKGGDDGSETKKNFLLICGVVFGVVVAVIAIVMVCHFCCRKNKSATKNFTQARGRQNAPGNGPQSGQSNANDNAQGNTQCERQVSGQANGQSNANANEQQIAPGNVEGNIEGDVQGNVYAEE